MSSCNIIITQVTLIEIYSKGCSFETTIGHIPRESSHHLSLYKAVGTCFRTNFTSDLSSTRYKSTGRCIEIKCVEVSRSNHGFAGD